MAINETIVINRKWRKCIDIVNKTWQRISFWTHSSDVEFTDGKTAETKVGAIDGITDSLASNSSRIAASAKAVNSLNNDLGGCSFETKEDGAYVKYTLPGGADPVVKKLCSGKFAYVTRTTTGSNNYATTFERPNNASSVFFIIFAYTKLSNVVLSSNNGKMEFIGKYGNNIHLYNISDLTGDFTISYHVDGTGTNTFYTIYSE